VQSPSADRYSSVKNPFPVLLIVVLLAGALRAFAQPADDVPLKFTRLDLTDGRKLKNVTVRSYDAKSEKLLVVADGKAMTIPIALVPAPFNEQLKGAPASGNSVSTIAAPTPRTIATAADQYQLSASMPVARRMTKAEFDAEVPRGAAPPARVQVERIAQPRRQRMAPAPVDNGVERHAAAARARATTYFRYEFQIGSNSISVTSLDFELSTPKPVPGWEGRYESQGKAFIEYYDSKGRSVQRSTSTFEVITEQKPGEDLTVVEFRRKS
jgi:hypothetical protein